MPASSPTPPTLADFESWVDEHTSVLVAFARRRLRDPRIAEETVQETFLAAWRARETFQGRSTLRTWLIGILQRKIVDAIRKESRSVPLTAAEQNLDDLFDEDEHYRTQVHPWAGVPEQDYARQEFRQNLKTCLDSLPVRLAQVFTLREVDGLERDAICQTLSVSSSNYWVMLHRARLKLRECLESRWFGAVREESP